MRPRLASFGDFRCAHCHALVSSAHLLSGVNNRNHCPYCLWSCHLDLFAAGDRLSACKAPMKPIGLTMKKSRNKYQRERGGELMLVHECVECRTLSINRIAADDDSETVMAVFTESFALGQQVRSRCQGQGIAILDADQAEAVRAQLYGHILERGLLIGV
ncbi:MAG: RNHCP domain-containing protein [Anaerolineales bacterium]|nr:RNHCP domain-containing protein [Anaerolineales bacterium]